MKSCLGILLVFFTFVSVIGGGGLIYYLSSTAEFSRKQTPAAPAMPAPAIPKAKVAIPSNALRATVPLPSSPPRALPVR